jgi:cytoskeletal protein RodZ
MQDQPSVSNSPPSTDLIDTLHHTTSTLFAPRYIGFIVGGILLLLLVAAIMIEDSAVASHSLPPNSQIKDNQTSISSDKSSASEQSWSNSATNVDLQPQATDSASNAQLHVNGRDVAMPVNGNTTQVVTNDASQTTIHTSNSSTQSIDGSSTSSSLSVDVQSKSLEDASP